MGSLEYFALGKTDTKVSGIMMKRHMAEPGGANTLKDRCSSPLSKPKAGVVTIATSGFNKPFSARFITADSVVPLKNPICNPESFRLNKMVTDRSMERTASLNSVDFNARRTDNPEFSSTQKLKSNWLYMTHRKGDKPRAPGA
jgi:hypothetical protein